LEDLNLVRSVERFLYREADLMDNHRYDDWLALWDQQLRYWVPCNQYEINPSREVSLIFDDRERLEDRLARLKGRHAHAQRPRSRLMRVISNVEVESGGDETLKASSQFVLGEVRLDRQVVLFGRSFHTIVHLLNNDTPMGNVTFLV
jgi:3-phenylpropionate/cinnamic acid dioxygenase small subunit